MTIIEVTTAMPKMCIKKQHSTITYNTKKFSILLQRSAS